MGRIFIANENKPNWVVNNVAYDTDLVLFKKKEDKRTKQMLWKSGLKRFSRR